MSAARLFVDGLSYAEARAFRLHPVGDDQPGSVSTGPGSWSCSPRPAGRPGPRHGPGPGRVRGAGDRAAPAGPVLLRDFARLSAEGTPLNRTSVRRSCRGGVRPAAGGPAPEASISPATPGGHEPAGRHGDRLRTWPEQLTPPGRAAAGHPRPGVPGPARADHDGRLPGTRVIPAASWLLSLLALKLTRTRRVSHVDDLLADPAAPCSPGSRSCRRRPR